MFVNHKISHTPEKVICFRHIAFSAYQKGENMYKVGDKVVHQREGACYIKDQVCIEVDRTTKEYYVLEPLADKRTCIYISMDPKKQKSIRRAITRKKLKEFEIMLDTLSGVWIEDARKRQQSYTKTVRTFDFLEVLSILKMMTVNNSIKKLPANDSPLLMTAEKLIYSEIAIVLELSYELVTERMKKFLCA